MKCSNCQAPNKKGDNFCKKCGATLKPAPKTVRVSTEEKQKTNFILILMGIAIVVLVAFVLLQPSGPSPQPIPINQTVVSADATLDDIMAGKPVVCILDELPYEGDDEPLMGLGVKWEYPKARMQTFAGGPSELMDELPDFISMGDELFQQVIIKDFETGTIYANFGAISGPYWWDSTGLGGEDFEIPPPEVMFGAMEVEWGFPPFDCEIVKDIPDSEFELPANAKLKSPSELSDDVLGTAQLDYLDQGYPISCLVQGTYQSKEYNRNVYFEGSKFAEDDRETKTPISVSDGSKVYAYIDQAEPYWLDVSDAEGIMADGRGVLENYVGMMSDDFYIACMPVSDIEDYKFRLPEGAEPSLYVPDLSIKDAIAQGYSVKCKSEDIKEGADRNDNLYFEAPKFALENWEDDYMWIIYDGEYYRKNYRVESGGRKWFDITDDPDEIKVTYDQMYTNYLNKHNSGDIALECQIVEDIPDDIFTP